MGGMNCVDLIDYPFTFLFSIVPSKAALEIFIDVVFFCLGPPSLCIHVYPILQR